MSLKESILLIHFSKSSSVIPSSPLSHASGAELEQFFKRVRALKAFVFNSPSAAQNVPFLEKVPFNIQYIKLLKAENKLCQQGFYNLTHNGPNQ